MAERLEVDPTKIPAPDFASEAYTFMRTALIADANTPEITTEELAAQRLKAQWEAHIEGLKVQYEAQLQEAEALRNQRIQEAADAEKLAAAEQQEKEKELAKESEKKRQPIYSFQKGVGVDSIPLQLHPYAKKMMTARKYVPLWYFLPDAATEAKERSKDSLDTNHLQFAVEDGDTLSGSTVSLVGSHTVRASPNAIPDSRLSWSQVMRAKSAFLSALGLGTWPDNYISMFAAFHINMDMHRELQEQDGDRVMAHYHAEMRQAWYDAMERKEPFDLSVISDRVIGESRREIVKQRQEKSLKAAKPQINSAKPLTLPPPPAKPTSIRTILTFNVPFGTQINPHSHAVTDASDVTGMMFDIAHGPPSGTGNAGLPATGTSKDSSRLQTAPMLDRNFAPTGNVLTVAQVEPTQRSTVVQDVQAATTELATALKASKTRVNTPLQVEAWNLAIAELNLTTKYPTLVESIRHGFNVGIPRIYHTFSPPNRLNEPESQAAFEIVMRNEISTGRWLGPYTQETIERVLGPFQTSPISMIPKSDKPGKYRLLENLSYPYHPTYVPSLRTTISSINSHIDSTLYPCLWSTFATTCRLIWTLPLGSQGAVRDISEAYRLIPLHPSQWPGVVIRTSEKEYCVDTRDMFGLTSAGGTFGHLADGGVDICRGYGLGPLTKWVDDHLWLRILKQHLSKYNSLREQLRERVAPTGGAIHSKGRLLYLGHTLPNGQQEEFDDDFIFPIRDLSHFSSRSMEDSKFCYAFSDIDRITIPLGYTWAADKDIPFCNEPTYFGFQWNLSEKIVSVPAKKRRKYLEEIADWEQRGSHNAEQVAKMYGKLLHVSLVLPIGRTYLIELEKFAAELSHEAPLTKHRAPRRWPADLLWWKSTLSSPISAPIPGPADLIDVHGYSDASSGYGIGLYIKGFWRAYRLLPGWKGKDGERDIGWAEAVGFYLLVLIIAREATAGGQYKLWGDNEGVVEGWWNGRSRNRHTNNIFRLVHEITSKLNFKVHTRYIPSAHNPADPFSRGIYGEPRFLLPKIPIPFHLTHLIIDYDAPYTTAERREYGTSTNLAYRTKPHRPHPRTSFGQWQSEEEGKLLYAFENSW
ncbi:reverse transcriptase ribonuclease h [Lentinula edodes]|uniref:Reverse transcriptase ribonuclease h n=1 Tax=Lentinula edodes TaxID=5353 RepID=A0A1Q3DUN7_LENED|nr:reverse transcriptase ribonuclease h [Lentinula edodes]